MVSAFIYPDGEKVFKEARFVDRERSPEKNQDKSGCFDVRAALDGSINVNIEARIAFDPNYVNRTLNYACCIHGGQLKRWEQGSAVTPTIFIGVLGRTQIKDREYYRDSASFSLDNGELCSDKIRLIFLDLPKFLKQVEAPSNKQERWLAYLAGTRGKEMEQTAEEEPMIQEALKAEEFFLADDEARAAYMTDWKYMMEEASHETPCWRASALCPL
jgi:predicted transposase/invertase (TIGR01784 family)